MDTREKILDTQALKEAMLSKNTSKVSVLRFLKSEIQRTEGGKFIMNENQIVNLVKKSIETVSGVVTDSKGNSIVVPEARPSDWEEQVSIYESFLPKQLSEDEVNEIMDNLIGNGVNTIGAIMGNFTKNYSGRIDGSFVSSLAKQKLVK